MAKISKEVIDRVRDNSDILDVVAQYVDLKQRGPNYFGICPFHDEKTPSTPASIRRLFFTQVSGAPDRSPSGRRSVR